MNVGGLFSGIGGWELGLERAGMRVLWHCESDPFCQRVLAARWPGVPCYPDVSELRGADVAPVDVLCGGFPCQDISVAGRGEGIRGARSGLWSEMFRLTSELRPRYLIVENVPALLVRGLDVVLTDLASIGFDAEWDCLRACDFGAPHERERFWLVAYPGGTRRRQDAGSAHGDEAADEGRPAQHHYVPDRDGEGGRAADVADTASDGRGQGRSGRPDSSGARKQQPALQAVADPDSKSAQRASVAWPERDPWAAEPDVARMAHGVPDGLDRRRALGNALIPQISEWIGRRVLDYEGLAANTDGITVIGGRRPAIGASRSIGSIPRR